MNQQEQQTIIQAHEVSFAYDEKPIVQNISFSIRSGECVSIIGPNGAGKTTLVRLLSRVLQPTSGEIFLRGRPLKRLNRLEIAREMAVVPQESVLGFPFSVREVVLMGRNPFTGMLGLEESSDYILAEAAMKRLDILHLADRQFDSLSGGERQRTILARALCQSPKVLLLDEPATHLDLSHQMAIHQLILDLTQEGVCVLAVTHDLTLAAEFFPRVMVLMNGSMIADGPADDVLTEERIQEVYHVSTHVDRNPVSGRPRISIHQ